uniref:Uncharacterized protein n=1 Tax=Arion vulgaris TaxID=1028688 RepID=A0A0B7AWF0_9EUPU
MQNQNLMGKQQHEIEDKIHRDKIMYRKVYDNKENANTKRNVSSARMFVNNKTI